MCYQSKWFLVLSLLPLTLYAVTEEECSKAINYLDLAVDMLLGEINRASSSHRINMEFKTTYAIYNSREYSVSIYQKSVHIGDEPHSNFFSFDIYVSKDDMSKLQKTESHSFHCEKVNHEQYGMFYLCCLVENSTKKKKLYSEAVKSGFYPIFKFSGQ